MSYQVAKLIARIAENLPEMSEDMMQGWIENPKALQRFLSRLGPPAIISKLKVFKTIKLGTGLKTAADFRRAIKDKGMKFGSSANNILGQPEFIVATEEIELDLIIVSASELGFKNGATREKIYDRVKELGLELCPVEVGPQLRLQYADQLTGEWLLIGMEPIRDPNSGLVVFLVAHDGVGLWIDSDVGDLDGVWNADNWWVFVRPRKCQK